MKTKNNLKAALGKSLKSEEEAVKSKYDKFSKADIVLDDYEKREVENREAVIKELSPKKNSKKCVRDSFTMPAEDHQIIDKIIDRFLDTRKIVNKSEVIRMALHALNQLPTNQLMEAYQSIEKVKIGRPK